MSEPELKIRPMLVSERLEMRLQGSPEPEKDKGYTMYPNWQLRMEITDAKALEAKLSKMEDALEHCGYDPTDCIDCGGPPHNEWCRFWKLRDVVPILFAAAEEEA